MPLRAIAAELDRRADPDQVRTALEAFHRPRRPQEGRRRWPGVRSHAPSPSSSATQIGSAKLSAYELAEASGVDRSVLSRFLAGKRTITLETADRLAEVLELKLTGW